MHKFKADDKVYIRGWDQETQATIVKPHETAEGLFPHYAVREGRKKPWIISQICMSTKPIVIKNGK